MKCLARLPWIALIALGILLAVGPVLAASPADSSDRPAPPPAPAPALADSATLAAADTTLSHRVLAYYFYTTKRCASCRKLEAYTAEAIASGFDAEVKTGALVFQPINVDEKGNEHFVKDYELFTKSVVLVDERSGKQIAWKNLPKVWQLLNDKEAFLRYVQEETRAYLTGKQS